MEFNFELTSHFEMGISSGSLDDRFALVNVQPDHLYEPPRNAYTSLIFPERTRRIIYPSGGKQDGKYRRGDPVYCPSRIWGDDELS
jgi:hypothetical protein